MSARFADDIVIDLMPPKHCGCILASKAVSDARATWSTEGRCASETTRPTLGDTLFAPQRNSKDGVRGIAG
jgi:hypothetical protein